MEYGWSQKNVHSCCSLVGTTSELKKKGDCLADEVLWEAAGHLAWGAEGTVAMYIYTEILLSLKKEWNIFICPNMLGPRDYHTKWNKSDEDTSLVCVGSEK